MRRISYESYLLNRFKVAECWVGIPTMYESSIIRKVALKDKVLTIRFNRLENFFARRK